MGVLVNQQRAVILLPALLLLVHGSAVAQRSSPEPEAPESLFEFDLGDSEVELFLDGEWTARSQFGATWQVPLDASRLNSPLYEAPGIAGPVPIENDVDLTVSLWLLGRYFFEAGLTEEVADSTFLVGYIGAPGELVQSVVVGNRSIEMGSYPYLGFGDSVGSIGTQDPGAAVLLQTERSVHEAMIRVSPGSNQVLHWSGGTLVFEERESVSEYVRARYFVLPDGSITSLRVFREARDGSLSGSDGRRYEELSLEQVANFSLSAGTIDFLEPQERRILVYYEVAGTPVGSPSIGRDAYFGLSSDLYPDSSLLRDFSFSGGTEPDALLEFLSVQPASTPTAPYTGSLTNEDVSVTVDGVDALVLHVPGRLSPFEMLNRYEAPEGVEAFGVTTSAGVPLDTSLAFVTDPSQPIVAVGDSNNDPRSFANRYPFASAAISEPEPRVYAPHSTADGAPILVTTVSQTSDRIVLPPRTVPGSVRVRRNGRPETGFILEDTGTLTFDAPLRPWERVTVSFRVSEGDGTDALVGIGNRLMPMPGLALDLAIGSRWNAATGGFSVEPDQNRGYLVVSAGISADDQTPAGEFLTGSATGALSFSTADTTGVLRLESMDQGISELSFSEYRLFPSAPPQVDIAPTPLPINRGILYYRNLYVTDGFGNRELLPYESTGSVSREPYEAGGRRGPYPAQVSQPGYTGPAMVLEYEIAGNTNAWVAGEQSFSEAVDLSGAVRLRIPYRFDPDAGTVNISLQLGALGEDADGDGVLDSGSGTLPFDDLRVGFSLDSGTLDPPVLRYSEDRNGNGVLDGALPERVVTVPLVGDLAPVSDTWETLSIPLSRDQAALLTSTRAVSVVIQSDSDDGVARLGTLAIGRISVDSEPLVTELPGAPGTESVSVYSQPDVLFADPLDDQFPELSGAILTGESSGNHLVVDWTGLSTGSVLLSRATNVRLSDYGELRVYARRVAGGPPNPTLTLRARWDGDGSVERSYALSGSSWHEVILDLPDEAGRTVTRVEIEIGGPEDGTVLLDEIGFWRPRAAVAAAGELSLRLTPPIEINIGSISALSNVEISQQLSGQNGGFPDQTSAPGVFSRTKVSGMVFGGQAASALDLARESGESGVALEYEVERPLGSIMTLRESFRSASGALGSEWTHNGGLTITIGAPFRMSAEWSSEAGSTLHRSWMLSAEGEGLLQLPVAANASAGFTEASAVPELSGYRARWQNGYTGLFGAADVLRRSTDSSIEIAVDGEPVGARMLFSAAQESDATTGRTASSVDAGVSLPFSLGGGQSVTLEFLRSSQATLTDGPAGSPAAQFGSMLSSPTLFPLSIRQIPVVELIDENFESVFTGDSADTLAATYAPELRISFRSPPRSTAWSLLVPTSASLGLRRIAERETDAVRSSLATEGQISFVALNQFGRMGSTPLFPFYDSDEFQTRVQATATESRDASWYYEINVNQQTLLLWNNGASLDAITNLQLDIQQKTSYSLLATIDYSWISHRRGRPEPRVFPPGWEVRQSETVSVTMDNSGRTLSSVGFRHETSFDLGQSRSVTAFLGGAVGRVTEPTDALLLGLEIGVSGSIAY